MSTENREKFGKPFEEFVFHVLQNRFLKKINSGFSVEPVSSRFLDIHWKTDGFIKKDGINRIAIDVKAPTGITNKNIDSTNVWFEPYNSSGEEKDISTIIMSEMPEVVGRYLAFIFKDVILFAEARRLFKWAVENLQPDFCKWNDPVERVKFRYTPHKRGYIWSQPDDVDEHPLALIPVKELESISGHKIALTDDEQIELDRLINNM